MNNAKNNTQNNGAAFCLLVQKPAFCLLSKEDSKNLQRPSIDLQLSDLTRTVHL